MTLSFRTSRADDREGFVTRKGRHGYVVAPTVHVVGLSLLFLAPGLLFALAIEWGSAKSHDEWALVLTLAIALVVGGILWFPTSAGGGLSTRSVFSSVAFSWVACSVVGAIPVRGWVHVRLGPIRRCPVRGGEWLQRHRVRRCSMTSNEMAPGS